ncbi:RNA polymerase sigma factor [Ruminococcus callidus]|uniref:RNA polymerase sigma factor n=1 Tax=Ruminococcus callidus TaxID=40519 RepID=UPI00266D1A6A|nr:RNA polymerase sigma factor [uncultured Ruminococcus sp.]
MPQDEAAFAKFYARHVDTVYRMCYMRMKNQMDAEDVTQDVFLRAMQQPQLWSDDDHARAWLLVTASNLCKNAMHHWSRTKREEVEDWEATLGTTASPDEVSAVMSAVMGLPDQYKTVVYLFYYEGYSGAEIAGMLGKKESTVRSLLHRGKKILLKALGGEPYAETGR